MPGAPPRVVMRFLAAPTDVNWGGKVHGGIVMRWIDEAAHVLATRWTGSDRNVAIFTGGVRFYRPLRIGHVVEVEARLLHTGRTSMHVGVHVRSGDPAEGADGMELTTYCRTIFVGDRRAAPGACRAPRGCRRTTRTGRWTPTPSSSCGSATASATDRVRPARPHRWTPPTRQASSTSCDLRTVLAPRGRSEPCARRTKSGCGGQG